MTEPSSSGPAAFRYFTGTGNTLRVARLFAAAFEEAGWTCSLAPVQAGAAPAADCGAACFFFPVHSLGLPRIARRYISALPRRERPARSLLVVTAGDPDDIGWALIEGSQALAERGYRVDFAELVRMPNNWLPFMHVPTREEAARILEEAEARAKALARSFLAGEHASRPLHLQKFGKLGSRAIHLAYHRMGLNRLWRHFRASGDCSSCGLCERACPTSSISMSGGRPRWSASCEQCMRCINLCPKRAILQFDSIGHGSRNNSYLEPHFDPLSEPRPAPMAASRSLGAGWL